MDNNDKAIDTDSFNDYVREYDIIPGLREIVKKAQEDNPSVQALALSAINIKRNIDDLKARGITTIPQLDTKLEEQKERICQVFDQYDQRTIAAKHMYTPIYILLEIL